MNWKRHFLKMLMSLNIDIGKMVQLFWKITWQFLKQRPNQPTKTHCGHAMTQQFNSWIYGLVRCCREKRCLMPSLMTWVWSVCLHSGLYTSAMADACIRMCTRTQYISITPVSSPQRNVNLCWYRILGKNVCICIQDSHPSEVLEQSWLVQDTVCKHILAQHEKEIPRLVLGSE